MQDSVLQEANLHARHGVFTVILLGENRKEKKALKKNKKDERSQTVWYISIGLL